METVTVYGSRSDVLRAPLVNTYSALSIAPYARGVNFIADNLASFSRSVAQDGAKLDQSHRLDRVLKLSPNPNQPAYQFWRKLFFDFTYRHNGYGYIARPIGPNGVSPDEISGLYNLEPEDVTPVLVYEDPRDITSASLWYYHKPSERAFSSADIIHLRGPGDGLIGHSPCDLYRQTFETAFLIMQRSARALRRGTTIIGTVEYPDNPSDEIKAQIRADLQAFTDPNGGRDVLCLFGGGTLKNAALNPQQMQLIEQWREVTRAFAQHLDLDPVYLFDRHESQYTNNAEQAGQDITRFTFRTKLENIENELTLKLLTSSEIAAGQTIRLNPDALLRGNTETQMKVVTEGVTSGVMKKNEGRDRLGLPRDENPESDQLLTPHAVASAPAAQGDK